MLEATKYIQELQSQPTLLPKYFSAIRLIDQQALRKAQRQQGSLLSTETHTKNTNTSSVIRSTRSPLRKPATDGTHQGHQKQTATSCRQHQCLDKLLIAPQQALRLALHNALLQGSRKPTSDQRISRSSPEEDRLGNYFDRGKRSYKPILL